MCKFKNVFNLLGKIVNKQFQPDAQYRVLGNPPKDGMSYYTAIIIGPGAQTLNKIMWLNILINKSNPRNNPCIFSEST